MQLSKEQIDQLFVFTKKKMVHWYDLQVEIVDHLAERIEEEMNANPKLNFEEALAKVYAGFGIFGFAKIVQEREKSLYNLGKRNFFKKLLQQLSWPTFIRTICIFLVVYLITTNLTIKNIAYLCSALIISGAAILFYRDRILYKMKKKLMMLYNPFDFTSSLFFYLEFQIIFRILFDNDIDNNIMSSHPILLSALTSLSIYAFIAQFLIKTELKTEAKRLYPEAFAQN